MLIQNKKGKSLNINKNIIILLRLFRKLKRKEIKNHCII